MEDIIKRGTMPALATAQQNWKLPQRHELPYAELFDFDRLVRVETVAGSMMLTTEDAVKLVLVLTQALTKDVSAVPVVASVNRGRSKVSQSHLEAVIEGSEASRDNKSIYDNPYQNGTHLSRAWARGFIAETTHEINQHTRRQEARS